MLSSVFKEEEQVELKFSDKTSFFIHCCCCCGSVLEVCGHCRVYKQFNRVRKWTQTILEYSKCNLQQTTNTTETT